MYVNAKMIPIETVARTGGRGMKRGAGGKKKYDIFDTLYEPL
jgi:hypothetical protein